MSRARRLNVFIVSSDGARPVRVHVPGWAVSAAVVVVTLGFTTVSVLVGDYIRVRKLAASPAALQRELAEQQGIVTALRTRIAEIRLEIGSWRELDAKIWEPFGPDVGLVRKTLGIGGATALPEPVGRKPSALEELEGLAETVGEAGQNLRALERLIAIDPGEEERHRRLISLEARYRGRDAALARAKSLAALLTRELDAGPEPATLALVEDIVFVYSNLNAFRVALDVIHKGHADMSDVELRFRFEKCLEVVDRAAAKVGQVLASGDRTDVAFLAAGIAFGLLAGLVSVKFGSVALTLGGGGGALVAGLVCGWYRSRQPTVGALPPAAQQILVDIGLGGFIAAIGLGNGHAAWVAIQSHGLLLVGMGLVVTLVPLIVTTLYAHRVLRMNPVIICGALAGAMTVDAAVTGACEVAESQTPVLGVAVPYAVGNVVLTVLGPIIVASTFAG